MTTAKLFIWAALLLVSVGVLTEIVATQKKHRSDTHQDYCRILGAYVWSQVTIGAFAASSVLLSLVVMGANK